MDKNLVLSDLVFNEYAGKVEEWIAVWRKEITTNLENLMRDYDGVYEWVFAGESDTSPGKRSRRRQDFALNTAFDKTSHIRLLRDGSTSLEQLHKDFKRKWNIEESSQFIQTLKADLIHLWEELLNPDSANSVVFAALMTVISRRYETPEPFAPVAASFYHPVKSQNAAIIESLHRHWTSTYISGSLELLRRKIRDQEATNIDSLYSKSILFVQFSGTGKSRLVDEYGSACTMINFVIRDGEGTGYPPADPEILKFLQRRASDNQIKQISDSPSVKEVQQMRSDNFPSKKAANIWHHSLGLGLLQASFEMLNDWIKDTSVEDLGDLASKRRRQMAPLRNWDPTTGHRSQERVHFCRKVAQRAERIADDAVADEKWRRAFNNKDKSSVRQNIGQSNSKSMGRLYDAIGALLKSIERLASSGDREGHDPHLVVVIDEASSLLRYDSDHQVQAGRYVALNRLISCLKHLPVWFFFISTESELDTLYPADDADHGQDYSNQPSFRLNSGNTELPLKRIEPFTTFQLDVHDKIRMNSMNSRQEELKLPMAKYASSGHMSLFGRPLWDAYETDVEIDYTAAIKIIGGNANGKYNPEERNQLFSVLSFRLCLDLCLENPKSLSLAKKAVTSFMRVVRSVDPASATLDTMSPSEPILAKAAMLNLCISGNWPASIKSACAELLQMGLIEKGLKGELYSRLLLVLAQDSIRRKSFADLSHEGLRSNVQFTLESTFTVREFLKALYVDTSHKLLQKIDRKILGAHLNFLHFTSTESNLSPDQLTETCHDLLRRSAALQLAPNQATYDQLIPFYCGDPEKPFDENNLGVILVQDKNRASSTTPSAIFREEFETVSLPKARKQRSIGAGKKRKRSQATTSTSQTGKTTPIRQTPYFVFGEMQIPILFLLFDLGAETEPQPLEVSKSVAKSPTVWAIHSRGHDERTFRCIEEMGCVEEAKLFFLSTTPRDNKTVLVDSGDLVKYPRHVRYQYDEDDNADREDGGDNNDEGDVKMAGDNDDDDGLYDS